MSILWSITYTINKTIDYDDMIINSLFMYAKLNNNNSYWYA